ncbi:MAG: DNA replication/repair protein RecF [Alphaproteobacteria bacterium]
MIAAERQFLGRPAAAGRLAVTRLTLTAFRSYAAARIEADTRPVALLGPNGAGKTNLLEAISFLVPGRGLRGAKLAEVARLAPGEPADPQPWAVSAALNTPLGPVEIGTGRDPAAGTESERRLVRIDGVQVRSQAALAEHVAAVWLTPQMDRLFTEGASSRRRFLDRLVFGFDPGHAGRVGGYENAMRQRARLLRDGRRDAAWLGALEEAMAARGIAIAAARRDLVRRLNAAADEAPGPFPRARAAIAGEVEDWLADMPALAAEDLLRDRLAAMRGRDADAGGAGLGTHRSDLVVVDAARDLPAARCSTGEQKALLVSIVLAHARLVAASHGTPPLLLLDEIAAHLDAARRAALFDAVCAVGAQAWMTGTDREPFRTLGDRAQFLDVQNSVVTPI